MILLSMIFCHIVDDYYLQGWLAQAKQKKWWQDNAPLQKYRYDYLMVLFMHAFSWTFMISIPLVWLAKVDISLIFYVVFIINILTHGFVDHLKANMKKTNLIQDQLIHILQILITYIIVIL